ncbi:MAG TPA: adenylate/guanylate cyclase domain-containing protein [Pyrinomonadaceae bacterium]|nr:adenylate/guanylate cyclase domain-containing protein [Pyrinomonadaceae bacterium]
MAAVSLHLRRLRLRARARRAEAEGVLEAELEREVLSSERLRVLVLLVVLAVGLALSLIPPAYFSKDIAAALRGDVQSFVLWRLAVLLPLVAYLFVQRALLARFIRSGRKAPPSYRYVTAFVETSFPTAEIMVGVAYADAVTALSAVPVFLYPLFVVLSALRLNFRLCVFTGAVAAAEYALVGALYLDGGGQLNPVLTSVPIHMVKGLALLSLGVVTGLVALQIKRRLLDSFRLAEERKEIVNTFGQHVSPAVVEKLLGRGAGFRSEHRDVCVMFLDIRDFTAFAESRRPEEVVEYLESLFDFMVEIVSRHRGIINKFLGDGFMAVFGAPLSDGRDCANAVAAAREILSRVEEEAASGRILPTRVGIGLHAGEAVTGSIGSALRQEYTVIGDVVNLASRIEQLNKQFGSRLLVSEAVWAAAREEGLGSALPMGHVPVKGREASTRIYRLA